MIKFENTEVVGWEAAIRGMRNPMNSWGKGDSTECYKKKDCNVCTNSNGRLCGYCIGPNDHNLMMSLANGGSVHAKYRRMIVVYVDITAPLYWWKEFDTYKVGTVANSCSTMHKIHEKEFRMEDFSCEHLIEDEPIPTRIYSAKQMMESTIKNLNIFRGLFLETRDKKYWWQMIQLLPSSYNQRRTTMLNYEALAGIYQSRKDHKLDEWRLHKEIMPDIDSTAQAKYAESYKEMIGFCDWIESLPFSELITGEKEKNDAKP